MTERLVQPAEWRRHKATWLAWPSHPELWGAALPALRRDFVDLCRALSPGERLEVLAADDENHALAVSALEGLDVRVHRVPFGDIWLRDTAPIFGVDRDGLLSAARFTFNGWGGKYDLPGDREVGERIAEKAGRRVVRSEVVAEGGAIEVDGAGTVLTTRQCLLNPNRNPGADEAALEAALGRMVGAEKVIWLDEGLKNDHTDGHIDTLARFVAPGRVVAMRPAADDPNRAALEAVLAGLRAATDVAGRRLEVIELPSPGAVTDPEGALMPASYANFYIGNAAVVVPTYGKPEDEAAVDVLAGLFPGRRVVGVDARAVLQGGGAFHCITQQEPEEGTIA